MRINNVLIRNWEAPGEQFWADVEARHDQPLIEAKIEMLLSWDEYSELLDSDENRKGMIAPGSSLMKIQVAMNGDEAHAEKCESILNRFIEESGKMIRKAFKL